MNNPYIRPEAVAVLGGSQSAACENTAVQPMNPTPKPSRWERIKSQARRAWGYIRQGFQFVKEYLVPIAVAATGILNACSRFQSRNNAERMAA